jgi:hypothetical protein
MKVMVLVKANPESEAGKMPSEKLVSEMMAFNEELVKAGVMLGAEGLQASSHGKRLRFEGRKRTVIDGPFAETKELLAGFWLWQVRNMDEAVEWARRIPNPEGEGDGEIEIRPVFEGEGCTEIPQELREKESRLRAQASQAAKNA